ncbi:uncharacterized protein [Symphalangus syndactylus]|uniref:uncharacterized protein n=1 Tax=Symphalangus syndactylus TaxID=9590 RepID=UPI003004B64D
MLDAASSFALLSPARGQGTRGSWVLIGSVATRWARFHRAGTPQSSMQAPRGAHEKPCLPPPTPPPPGSKEMAPEPRAETSRGSGCPGELYWSPPRWDRWSGGDPHLRVCGLSWTGHSLGHRDVSPRSPRARIEQMRLRLHVCVWVGAHLCVRVWVHICVCVCLCVCACGMGAHLYVCACVCACVGRCTFVCACLCVCTRVWVHICMCARVWVHICVGASMCGCTFVCACLCACVWVHIVWVHICMCAYVGAHCACTFVCVHACVCAGVCVAGPGCQTLNKRRKASVFILLVGHWSRNTWVESALRERCLCL